MASPIQELIENTRDGFVLLSEAGEARYSNAAAKTALGDDVKYLASAPALVAALKAKAAGTLKLPFALKLDLNGGKRVLPAMLIHAPVGNTLALLVQPAAVTVEQPALAFAHISTALRRFLEEAGLQAAALVPISALKGSNVVEADAGWCGYDGPSLLSLLETLPDLPSSERAAAARKFLARAGHRLSAQQQEEIAALRRMMEQRLAAEETARKEGQAKASADAAAAIVVLLAITLLANLAAILIRTRYERAA